LTQVLRHLVPFADPAVLVDSGTGDDAAVYRLAPDRALVATVDFFTPIVDDPFDYGRIAAANALSDIYAMGATPLFALNLISFPRRLLDSGLLEEIVRGGGVVAREAGIAVVGGHSIDDEEPKFGMCVIGEVHPDRIVRNVGARAGDALVLTKPLGTGVIATALKREAAAQTSIDAAVTSMTTLNRGAAYAMLAGSVHAATDVTGFGLVGHLDAMLSASGVGARIDADAVPLLPGARELVEAGHIPGGTKRNMADAAHVQWHDVDEITRTLLCDAQTSGGLLIAIPESEGPALLDRLQHEKTPAAAVIGQITATTGIEISPP
jgi:selenide, water dikinase